MVAVRCWAAFFCVIFLLHSLEIQFLQGFASISPDWQGATSARMQMKLFMEEFSLQSATDLEQFQLKRGLPLATDVLVHLEAQTVDNKTMHIPTIGTVKDSGNILIHLSEYDPQRLKSLTLSIAPLVAERSFNINWPSLPPEAVLASDFPVSTRCSESLFLQDRYAVCRKEGTWPVQGIKHELWPWTMNFNIPFKIEPMEAEKEAMLWTEGREHRVFGRNCCCCHSAHPRQTKSGPKHFLFSGPLSALCPIDFPFVS